MKRSIVLLLVLITLTSFTAAQNPTTEDSEINKVILASTANYPDAYIASSPSEKLGIPVLLTQKNKLTSSTEQTIKELGVNEVIIVGGPAVISDSVQSKVETMVNSTTRLFGTTQIGTSIEVSSYFWADGSESATIVQYPQNSKNGYKLLSAVKNEVQDEDEPILISKTGTLSASVLSEIDRLGATEVDVYSTNAVNVTQDLKNIGVEDVELNVPEKEENEIEQLSDKVQSNLAEASRNKSSLVIVAAANFRNAISVPVAPNSASYVVGSQDQISRAVQLVRDTEAQRIKVTGKPELAQQIVDAIQSQTNRTAELVSGSPEKVATKISSQNRKQWNKLQNKRYKNWKQKVLNSEELRKQANRTLNKAENLVDSNSTEDAREHLSDAREAYREGKYFEARKSAIKALSIVNSNQYQRMKPEEVREAIQDEREDMREAVKEMRELSKEMAQKLKEAENQKERLEIIQEFREERREMRKEMKEEARENRKDRKEEKERVGKSEVKIKVEDNEVEARVEYTAPTLGYSWSKNVEQNNGKINFNFNLKPPQGMAAQQVKEYKTRESIEVQNGTYQVKVVLKAEGRIVNTLNREVEIPGIQEYETEMEESKQTDTESSEPSVEVVKGVKPDKTISLTNYKFSDTSPSISKGQVIRFVNKEGSHTVTLDTAGIDKTLSGSESITLRFNEDRNYQIYCKFHGSPGEEMHTNVEVD